MDVVDATGERMIRDVFVVAGDVRQFQQFMEHAQEQLKREIKRKMVHYVVEPGVLKTSKSARVFLYGTYFKRRDWEEIEVEIAVNGHRKLLVR